MRRPLLFFILVALAACVGKPHVDPEPEQGPTTDRIVLSREDPEPEVAPKQPAEWYDRQIELAEKERNEGRIRDALERLYIARGEAPPKWHRIRIDELIRSCNEDVLDLKTLDAWIGMERDPMVFGDAVRIRIHFHNNTQRRVHIPARKEGTTGSLFVLVVSQRDYDIRAQAKTDQRRVFKQLDEDLDIPPGATTEVVLQIPEFNNATPLEGFRAFYVNGVLRPAVIDVGGLRRWEAIPIRGGRGTAFRPNWEHLADDPVARVKQAIEKQAGVHLLTAAALVPYDDRRAAVDAMIEELQGDRLIDWAMFAALQHLTQVELGRDAGAWRAWWPRVREEYFNKLPDTVPTDVPSFD